MAAGISSTRRDLTVFLEQDEHEHADQEHQQLNNIITPLPEPMMHGQDMGYQPKHLPRDQGAELRGSKIDAFGNEDQRRGSTGTRKIVAETPDCVG
eukprot:9474336-Pyramimonas_sp.AAC.1